MLGLVLGLQGGGRRIARGQLALFDPRCLDRLAGFGGRLFGIGCSLLALRRAARAARKGGNQGQRQRKQEG